MKFSYELGKTVANVKLYSATDVVQFHASTGTYITILDINACRLLTGYSGEDIRKFINKRTTDLTYRDLSGTQIKIVPCVLRDVIVGYGNDEAMFIPEFRVFLTSEDILWNILGMDFLSSFDVQFDSKEMVLHNFDDEVYKKNFIDSCSGHKIYEISDIMSEMSSDSLWDVLKRAEG